MDITNARDNADLGDDLIAGGKEIAAFFGMPERKIRHLMKGHKLPGCFQMPGGTGWFLSKSIAREAVKKLASAGRPGEK
jgi:hypothetical protein